MRKLVSLAATATLAGGLGAGLLAGPADAAAASHSTTTIAYVGTDLMPHNPFAFSMQPPFVSPIPAPGNCPFDMNAVFTVTGNTVGHTEGNNNGFWATGTGEGAAVLTDPHNGSFNGPYNGQATGWGGFGTNGTQMEAGQTFHFHGTNLSGQVLDVVFDYHFTFNNAGTLVGTPKIDFECNS